MSTVPDLMANLERSLAAATEAAARRRADADVNEDDELCPHGHTAPWLCDRCSDDERAEAAERLDGKDGLDRGGVW